jgi:hypothetical protein
MPDRLLVEETADGRVGISLQREGQIYAEAAGQTTTFVSPLWRRAARPGTLRKRTTQTSSRFSGTPHQERYTYAPLLHGSLRTFAVQHIRFQVAFGLNYWSRAGGSVPRDVYLACATE